MRHSLRRRLAASCIVVAVAASGAVISAGPAFAATAESVEPSSTSDTLFAGEVLRSGEELISPNGGFRLRMQADGNAVVYDAEGIPNWSTGTSGAGNLLAIQGDGNLVVYDAGSRPLWASRSSSNDSARLVMQDDGNLVIYTAAGRSIWASAPTRFTDTLGPGGRLGTDQKLTSSNGSFQAVLQRDANFVVYGPQGVRWNSGTNSSYTAYIVMQSDGNAVIYNGPNVLWQSGTAGSAGARLVMQNDGNLVIYAANGAALWSSQAASATVQPARDTLSANQQLGSAEYLTSTNGRMRAVMQSDGNFVVYDTVFTPPSAQWSAGTNGVGNRLVMQADGNAVIYGTDGRARFSTGTGGNPGARLVIQNDANLVVYSAGGSPLWTYRRPGVVYFAPFQPIVPIAPPSL